jgi:hypothetical protein
MMAGIALVAILASISMVRKSAATSARDMDTPKKNAHNKM